jgi:hypothetical protein
MIQPWPRPRAIIMSLKTPESRQKSITATVRLFNVTRSSMNRAWTPNIISDHNHLTLLASLRNAYITPTALFWGAQDWFISSCLSCGWAVHDSLFGGPYIHISQELAVLLNKILLTLHLQVGAMNLHAGACHIERVLRSPLKEQETETVVFYHTHLTLTASGAKLKHK